jgi:hypothetical protein
MFIADHLLTVQHSFRSGMFWWFLLRNLQSVLNELNPEHGTPRGVQHFASALIYKHRTPHGVH